MARNPPDSHAYLPWPDLNRVSVESVSRFDDPAVAPAHGHVIREDGERYMRMMKRAVTHVASNDQPGVQVYPGMTVRRLTSEVRWVSRCHGYEVRYEHVSLYILSRGDRHVLVDSGAQTARAAVQGTLDDVLDGDALEAVVLTHADLPRSWNVPMLRDVPPDIDVYSSSGLPAVVGLSDDVEKCDRGETMTIGSRELSFVNPPLQDIDHSTWVFDETDDVPFTADGSGNTHVPGDCGTVSTEFWNWVPRSAIDAFHRHKLRWLVYANPGEIMNAVRELLERWDPVFVVPIHGNPIARESIEGYPDRMGRSLDTIAEEQRRALRK